MADTVLFSAFRDAWDEFLGAATRADAGDVVNELKNGRRPLAHDQGVLRELVVATLRARLKAQQLNVEAPRVMQFWANGVGAWSLTWDTPNGQVVIQTSAFEADGFTGREWKVTG